MENIKVALMKHATDAMKESHVHDFLASDYVPKVFDNFSATVVVGESTVNLGIWVLLKQMASAFDADRFVQTCTIDCLALEYDIRGSRHIDLTFIRPSVMIPQICNQCWDHETNNMQLKPYIVVGGDSWRVTTQSCSGAVFNHFMGKFECSSSSQTPYKMAEQKEERYFDAATVVNKEAAAHGQKEESCLDAATVVNKEAAATRWVFFSEMFFLPVTKDISIALKLASDAIAFAKTLVEQCTICLEQFYNSQMFTVSKCCHKYCPSYIKSHEEAKLLQGMKLPEYPHEGCKSRLDIKSCMEFLTPKSHEIMILWEKEASIPPAEQRWGEPQFASPVRTVYFCSQRTFKPRHLFRRVYMEKRYRTIALKLMQDNNTWSLIMAVVEVRTRVLDG
nr:ribonuclease H domain-containing protein [Tanacetum cinerariifolium]